MNISSLLVLCYLVVVIDEAMSLMCRSSNQQADMQFQKVLRICKKRISGHDSNDSDSGSSDSSSSESNDSEAEDFFDKKMLSKNRDTGYSSRSNNRRQNFDVRSNDGISNTYNRTNGNWRNSRMNKGKYNDNNTFGDKNDFNREQACILQCFFAEFNAVDRRGFPIRDAVLNLLTQNIHNPELQEFVEQSIFECFRYLDTYPRREKCEFSQNLVTCFANKSKERCEDWDD